VMKLHERIFLYMDVLGAKNAFEEKEDVFVALVEAFSNFWQEYICKLSAPDKDGMHDLEQFTPEISNFSDHIAASFPIEINGLEETASFLTPATLINLSTVFNKIAFEKGFLMRGAITKGRMIHNGNRIFGKPLNDADEIEKSIAIYPRVILANETREFFKGSSTFVEQDFDGLYFINYLKSPSFVDGLQREFDNNKFIESIKKIRELIHNEMKKNERNQKIIMKWNWLANKFNDSLKYYEKKFPSDELKKIEDL
jgi:hypothetical protein